MAQMIKCDNERRQPHFYPPQQNGSFKIVDCSEYILEPIQWEERDFCSMECLRDFAIDAIAKREGGRGRNRD